MRIGQRGAMFLDVSDEEREDIFQKSGPLVGNFRALGAILRSKKARCIRFCHKKVAPFAPYFHNWGPILLHCIFLRPKKRKKSGPHFAKTTRLGGQKSHSKALFRTLYFHELLVQHAGNRVVDAANHSQNAAYQPSCVQRITEHNVLNIKRHIAKH